MSKVFFEPPTPARFLCAGATDEHSSRTPRGSSSRQLVQRGAVPAPRVRAPWRLDGEREAPGGQPPRGMVEARSWGKEDEVKSMVLYERHLEKALRDATREPERAVARRRLAGAGRRLGA